MNAIRNYLDNMFRNLPNTEAVRKAKSELLQMMEDKYEELIAEGKTENEAVGIVISEFGNLDELADSLGITEAVQENPDENKPMLSMQRVKDYITMNNGNSIIAPLGIALCIFSVAMNIVDEIIPLGILNGLLGIGGMFGLIAIAVGLFIFSGIRTKEYAEVMNKECSLSIECAEYVRNERKSFKTSYGLMMSFGIALCILSVVNPVVFDRIPYISSSFGAVMFFAFIALGVFLITSANTRMDGYDRLLALNESGKMSEEFVPKSDRKVNKAPIIIAAVIVAVLAIGFGVARFVFPLFSGVFIKNDIGDTIATTYNLSDGDNMNKDYNTQGEVNSIKLDLSACSVNFDVTDGEGLLGVEYTGDKRLMPEVSLNNGKLVITQTGTRMHWNIGSINAPKLTIKLGKDVNIENLEMKINAGDVKINGLKGDYLFGDFDAGNIIMDGCDFRKADIDADAGNIKISDSSIKIMKIDTDAGNIEIKKTAFEDVQIDTDFGNVDLDNIEDLDSYDIDCKVDAGVVQINNSVSGRSYSVKGSGTGSIKINVDAGNIEIN